MPTRKRFRQGRRRAFHLYHACAMGPIRFGDMDMMAFHGRLYEEGDAAAHR